MSRFVLCCGLYEQVPHARPDGGARDNPPRTRWGGGTHVAISAVNRQTTAERPLVPHPRCASTTHYGVRA